MSFLDPKENVMAIILTQYGRKKLAEGNLKVKYFAFSDDEINYQTSFSSYISGVALLLDLTTGGAFLRSTSASYYTNSNVQSASMPVHYQGATISWAPPDVRRFENSLLLLEGSRTNELPVSIDAPGSHWTYASGSGTTGHSAPDGTNRARWTPDQGGVNPIYLNMSGILNQAASSSLSAFYKASASYSNSRRLYIGESATMSATFSIDQVWNRYFRTGKGASSDEVYVSHIGGGYLFGLQLEFSSTFPTSYISTSIGAATRGADILFYENIPANIRTDSFEFYIEPMFSSDESLSSSYDMNHAYTLMSFGSNDYIKIVGSRIHLAASSGGPSAFVISSSALSWARYQRLMIQVSPKDGRLSVFSSSLGAGSVYGSQFSFGGNHLFIGSMSGTNGDPYFGRISSIYG